jgi:hypothetical protein
MSSFNISINEENCELSALYWIPKFQKNQYLDRYIPCSSTCSTKELSITMTKIVHAVKGGLLSYCDKVYSHGNINQKHRIGGVMISVLASSAVDHGFESQSGQAKDYNIGICLFFFFNNVIYFIQMLATINTPKVQAPFGVSLLHLVLIIQGYNQNYMKYIYNLNTISI